jgi:hypothetical protein
LDVIKTDLIAREVYKIPNDVTIGERTMHRASEQQRNSLSPLVMTVSFDGWVVAFQIDGTELECCEQSVSQTNEWPRLRPGTDLEPTRFM